MSEKNFGITYEQNVVDLASALGYDWLVTSDNGHTHGVKGDKPWYSPYCGTWQTFGSQDTKFFGNKALTFGSFKDSVFRVPRTPPAPQPTPKVDRLELMFPNAVKAMQDHIKFGDDKHRGGQAARLDDKYIGAQYSLPKFERHLEKWRNGETLDEEFGESHWRALAWHCLNIVEGIERSKTK